MTKNVKRVKRPVETVAGLRKQLKVTNGQLDSFQSQYGELASRYIATCKENADAKQLLAEGRDTLLEAHDRLRKLHDEVGLAKADANYYSAGRRIAVLNGDAKVSAHTATSEALATLIQTLVGDKADAMIRIIIDRRRMMLHEAARDFIHNMERVEKRVLAPINPAKTPSDTDVAKGIPAAEKAVS